MLENEDTKKTFQILAIQFSTMKRDNPDSEELVDITSEQEQAILNKDSDLHEYYDNSQTVELTNFGVEFIKAVNGRRKSLLNQKNNLALFPGLTGSTPLEVTKEIIKLKLRRNRTKKGTKKHTDLQNKIEVLDAKLKRDKSGNTIGLIGL